MSKAKGKPPGPVVRKCCYCGRPTRCPKVQVYVETHPGRWAHAPRPSYAVLADGSRLEVPPLCRTTVQNDAAYRDAVLVALGAVSG